MADQQTNLIQKFVLNFDIFFSQGSIGGTTTRTTRNRLQPIDINKQDIKDPFENLFGVIDSEEESDSGKKREINVGKRKVRVIESEDESSKEEIENELY